LRWSRLKALNWVGDGAAAIACPAPSVATHY